MKSILSVVCCYIAASFFAPVLSAQSIIDTFVDPGVHLENQVSGPPPGSGRYRIEDGDLHNAVFDERAFLIDDSLAATSPSSITGTIPGQHLTYVPGDSPELAIVEYFVTGNPLDLTLTGQQDAFKLKLQSRLPIEHPGDHATIGVSIANTDLALGSEFLWRTIDGSGAFEDFSGFVWEHELSFSLADFVLPGGGSADPTAIHLVAIEIQPSNISGLQIELNEFALVPEPTHWSLIIASGLGTLVCYRRRKMG